MTDWHPIPAAPVNGMTVLADIRISKTHHVLEIVRWDAERHAWLYRISSHTAKARWKECEPIVYTDLPVFPGWEGVVSPTNWPSIDLRLVNETPQEDSTAAGGLSSE